MYRRGFLVRVFLALLAIGSLMLMPRRGPREPKPS